MNKNTRLKELPVQRFSGFQTELINKLEEHIRNELAKRDFKNINKGMRDKSIKASTKPRLQQVIVKQEIKQNEWSTAQLRRLIRLYLNNNYLPSTIPFNYTYTKYITNKKTNEVTSKVIAKNDMPVKEFKLLINELALRTFYNPDYHKIHNKKMRLEILNLIQSEPNYHLDPKGINIPFSILRTVADVKDYKVIKHLLKDQVLELMEHIKEHYRLENEYKNVNQRREELRKTQIESTVIINKAEPYEIEEGEDASYCFGPNLKNKVVARHAIKFISKTAVAPLTKDKDNIESGITCRVKLINRDGFSLATAPLVQRSLGKALESKVRALAREFISKSIETAHIEPQSLDPLNDEEMSNLFITNDNIVMKMTKYMRSQEPAELKINAKSFIKKEAYPDEKDCRCITEQSLSYLINLARFTIKAKKMILKKNIWYGPGRNGKVLTYHLNKLKMVDEIWASDFSRFDGTQSRLLRTLIEKEFYLQVFKPEHHELLDHLFELDFGTTVKTKDDEEQKIEYPTNGSRQSGSALTTDGNTINNAGTYYITCRLLGFTSEEAWIFTQLSLFYGDDAVFVSRIGECGFNVADYEDVLSCLGMDIKLEPANKNRIPFLSRFFDIQTQSSIPDLTRALAKMGMYYVNDPRTPEQQIFDRIYGYYVNDPNHPVIKAIWNVVACGLAATGKINTKSNKTHEEIVKINNGSFPADDITNLLSVDYEKYSIPSYDILLKTLRERCIIY